MANEKRLIEYFVIKEKNTGLYFRGKGVNRWGKYYNQASIYRIKGQAEHTADWLRLRGEPVEILQIQIIENATDAVEVVHGRWEKAEYHGFLRCSECKDVYIDDTWVTDGKWNYCPNCGADMRERKDNDN